MDFLGIRTEVFARGFQYLNDGGTGLTRVKRWVNDAMHEVDRKENWSYTLVFLSSGLPATVTGVHHVESVVDNTNHSVLVHVPRATLTEMVGDTLNAPGRAEYWYRGGSGSTQRVESWPVSTTAAFLITYFAVQPDLVNDTDVPLMPDEYRQIIVELACRMAYRDSENFEAAADCLAAAEIILGEMRENLLDLPDMVARTTMAEDD